MIRKSKIIIIECIIDWIQKGIFLLVIVMLILLINILIYNLHIIIQVKFFIVLIILKINLKNVAAPPEAFIDKGSLDNKNLDVLSEKFLNDSSYLFKDLKIFIDKQLENKEIKFDNLQKSIENFIVEYEQTTTYNELFKNKDIGEHSEVINSLKNQSLPKLEKILINFTYDYRKNEY